MHLVIGILLIIFIAIFVWFSIPYSPVKSNFRKNMNILMSQNQLMTHNEVFKEDDFQNMPAAIQKYVINCGYIGKPKMSYVKMVCKNVEFIQGRNGIKLTIDYTECNFVKKPSRLALIKSSMFGIPFEGYDYYQNGIGGMKGVIAKLVTLFHQTGTDMDKACLATFLAESVFAPNILLQDYITFEEISDLKVKATITNGKQTASGIFTFNEKYEMISFTTNDRGATGADGKIEYIPWSALCSDYKMLPNGIQFPSVFKAVWNYDDGDFTYFNGIISEVTFGI